MSDVAVCFFEVGFPRKKPMILQDLGSLDFPFWGNWHFIDFSLCNYSSIPSSDRYLFLQENRKIVSSFLTIKWKNEVIQILYINEFIEDFIRFLEQIPQKVILLSNISHIALYSYADIQKIIDAGVEEIIKISINGSPIDLYITDKDILLGYLRDYKSKSIKRTDIYEVLFEDILLTSFDSITEIPGELLFNNTLTQLYHNNLLLNEKINTRSCPSTFAALSLLGFPDKESYISGSGHVINSFIGSGSVISGYVENSIIFSDVVIEKNAKIYNSVIMNKNQVGKNAVIQNAVIFPYVNEVVKGVSNIGEKCYIGGKSTSLQNTDFPELVSDGITVIGSNSEVPKAFRIEGACLVGSDILKKDFKKMEKLKKGSCFFKVMEN